MIKTVIRLRNDAVMVFDAAGEQMPEYQGKFTNVKDRIIRDAPAGACFNHWFGYAAKPKAIAATRW